MGSRMTWPQLQRSDEFRGLWVALDDCTYDSKTAQPVEGSVVDADEDLAELCSRIRQGESRHCAILFCDGAPAEVSPSSARRPELRSGLFTH
jgi:hypothetical protein